ncbi:D-isomer specific 2-hydroxyacid dehydrogenase [Cinnamomum micranthum f. kanehirae]|uniref:D-isomer specific 2-hydroxyacid dehydrogenase n=1 Tax=Cinnamomum micranthum f. kanehirae TaxID=337451 RepID=A0A443NGF8_9MAGN|nr:D-isomer specific 2-hydroxyacid dehydrogenase [Cinnamomum micranthum f. kanehirae]
MGPRLLKSTNTVDEKIPESRPPTPPICSLECSTAALGTIKSNELLTLNSNQIYSKFSKITNSFKPHQCSCTLSKPQKPQTPTTLSSSPSFNQISSRSSSSMMSAAASSNLLSTPSLRKPWGVSLPPRVASFPALPRRTRHRSLVIVLSMGAKPTVLITEKLGEAGLELLRGFANVDCSYNLSHEELCTKISLCDALIVRSGTKVTREVFESSVGRLKVVGRAGVGIDNVDLAAATEHGCLVVNAPTANTIAAAEHGIALLAAMARNIAQASASMKAGEWKRSKYVGVSFGEKTLAVMGFGKVGSEVARRAKFLGMKVIAHDPYAPADRARAMGIELVTFDEALSRADFISLHMPLTPATSKINE